jgi:hypothetical protein
MHARIVQPASLEARALGRGGRILDRIQDTGCRIQDTGCRIQDTGCRIQDAGYRMQDTGWGMLNTGWGDAGYRIQNGGCWRGGV